MSASFICLFSVFLVQTMNFAVSRARSSGRVHVGDTITTLPSNETAAVKTILVGSDNREEAVAGQAVTIQLDKEVDVSRGCVLTNNNEIPVAKGL